MTDSATPAQSASASLTVVVAPVPFVVATADRYFASPQTVVRFKGLAIGGTGDITYTWDFGDGRTFGGRETVHAYDEAGLFTVVLKARDAVGGENEARLQMSIAPLDVTVIQSATSVRTGEFVNFIAFASGGTGGPYSYSWNFGDGTSDSRPKVSKSYADAGTFAPSITVYDGVSQTPALQLESIIVADAGLGAAGAVPYFEVGLGLVGLAAVSVGTVTAVRRRRRRRRWGPRPR